MRIHVEMRVIIRLSDKVDIRDELWKFKDCIVVGYLFILSKPKECPNSKATLK